jgi:hypothetical protein
VPYSALITLYTRCSIFLLVSPCCGVFEYVPQLFPF